MMRQQGTRIGKHAFSPEPSGTEAILILAVTFLVQIAEALRSFGWLARATGLFDDLDNSNYLAIAEFIRKWAPTTSFDFHQFWGYPYFIIGVSSIFHLPGLQTLLVISLTSSMITCLLLYRLYGGLVAVAFGMISSTWILLSVFGGVEPLFMALLFAAFLATRRERWLLATFLGCVATTVRPVGVLMPVALFANLLYESNWKAALRCIGLSIASGIAYVTPVYLLTGSPIAQLRMYSPAWQAHGFPFAHRGLLTFPTIRLFQGFWYLHDRWNSWPASTLRLGWILIAIGGAILLWLPKFSNQIPPVERIFACAYSAFLVCYNYDFIAMDIPRLILPVLPLMLFTVRKWIPRDRRFLWPLVALSIACNTVILFGFQTVFGFKLPGIRLTPKLWE